MKPKIKWLHWSWFFLTLMFLAFRFQNCQGVLTSEGVILNDTDPYYRLHRIHTMLNQNELYPLNDQNLSSPTGVNVPWPLGLDFLIATPLALYNSISHVEVESFGAVAIPFMSLPLLWAAMWIAGYYTVAWCALLVGFLICVSSTLMYQTGIGRLDHHFLESMLPILILMFLLKYHRRKNHYDFTWIVLILGLSPSFAPQGWILAPLMGLALLFDRNWSYSRDYAKMFFYACLISLIPLSLSDRFYQGYVVWFSFSWWSPWLYACGALAFIFIDSLNNKSFKKIDSLKIGIVLLFGSIVAFLVLKNSDGFLKNNIVSSVTTVVSKTKTMATTLEVRSPFQLSFEAWTNSDFIVLVVGMACFLFFLFRKQFMYLLGYCLIPILLAINQLRFMTMASALLFILIVLFFHQIVNKAAIKEKYKGLIISMICLMLIIPFRPPLGFTNIKNTHYYYQPIRAFSFFLNSEFKRLNKPKNHQPILAHWDYGHWLLYYTGLPVIADPFQGASAYEVLELFTSNGTDELEPFLRKHPADYLIIESGAVRSYQWITAVGKNDSLYFDKFGETGSDQLFRTNAAFEDLFMFRFFFELGLDARGNHPEHWRLIYISPYASPNETDLAALKAYERVPGVKIHVTTKKIHSKLHLETEITEFNEVSIFQQTMKNKKDFTWTVPYGYYEHGNVISSGKYVIKDENGKILYNLPLITEKQVLQGDSIHIQF